ncbi:MAG TPA: 2-C-methyl-D-erythritol 4-phosphate cytidylyltransferase [Solirubrobacteraceae bacterium]
MAVALIVAAGRGERLGVEGPKALVELAGRPLLQWSVDALRTVAAVKRIVVALPAGASAPEGTIGVPGGAVRSESVRLALRAAGAGPDSEPVLVHDAARPLLTPELAMRVLAAVDGVPDAGEAGSSAAVKTAPDAAIAAAAVTDTVKRAGHDRRVLETLDRSELWAVQTPQVFRRGALERALDVSDEVLASATDDAWLIERMGGSVVVVEAPRENLKVTTALDLAVAELLLARRPA